MNEDRLLAPRHRTIRSVLRIGGPIVGAIGVVCVMIGVGSFFSSFGTFEPPRYFWCAFIGLPLLFVGGTMSMYGYLGALHRYVAGESAPVAKDVVNYMGENIRPGVKAVAKAVAEGVLEAQREQPPKPGGPA
jgi:hypothetical protein